MRKIGLLEAKTNLSKIVEQVRQSGQPVTLTKRGEPWVDLVPHQGARPRRSKAEVFAELDRLRRGLPKISKAEIEAAIAQVRR
jgi:prevent-host-death family protein